jgi:hypothetical protein
MNDNANKILLLTPKWSTCIMEDPRKEPFCFASEMNPAAFGDGKTRVWSILLALPTDRPYPLTISFPAVNGPMKGKLYKQGAMEYWGLRKIGPGTWAVDPSVQEDCYKVHAYVVLCEVPEPAPWEM